MREATRSFDASVTASWRHRVHFTHGALDTRNETLASALTPADDRPARTLAVVDAGLAEATPTIESDLQTYATAHGDRFEIVETLALPGGEAVKNDRAHYERIVRAIVDRSICRKSYVLAVGGGALLDAAGFAAATAHRGVRLVRIPTTTLAQDDAGVGVKCGVNHLGKKNLLGAFAPPWAVVNDFDFLSTLTDRHWRSGFAEAVKVALVKDGAFFETVERDAQRLVERDMEVAARTVERSARLHFEHITVGGDPFEMEEARPLDFGHWSAHRLEEMTNNRLTHGEAVALGVALDCEYARRMGWLDETSVARVLRTLESLGFSLWDDALKEFDALEEGIESFREHLGGRLTLTMLRGIGEVFDVHEIDADTLRASAGALRERAAQASSVTAA